MNCRIAALLALVLVLVSATAGCAALFGPHAEYPSIASMPGAAEPVTAEHAFRFEDGTETVGVTIDAAVLAGARASTKRVLLRGDVPEEEWVAGAYRAQVSDPAQDRFFADLLAGFREVRDRRGARRRPAPRAHGRRRPAATVPHGPRNGRELPGRDLGRPERGLRRQGPAARRPPRTGGLPCRTLRLPPRVAHGPRRRLPRRVRATAGQGTRTSRSRTPRTSGSCPGGPGTPRLRSWSQSGTARPGTPPPPTSRLSRRRG